MSKPKPLIVGVDLRALSEATLRALCLDLANRGYVDDAWEIEAHIRQREREAASGAP